MKQCVICRKFYSDAEIQCKDCHCSLIALAKDEIRADMPKDFRIPEDFKSQLLKEPQFTGIPSLRPPDFGKTVIVFENEKTKEQKPEYQSPVSGLRKEAVPEASGEQNQKQIHRKAVRMQKYRKRKPPVLQEGFFLLLLLAVIAGIVLFWSEIRIVFPVIAVGYLFAYILFSVVTRNFRPSLGKSISSLIFSVLAMITMWYLYHIETDLMHILLASGLFAGLLLLAGRSFRKLFL